MTPSVRRRAARRRTRVVEPRRVSGSRSPIMIQLGGTATPQSFLIMEGDTLAVTVTAMIDAPDGYRHIATVPITVTARIA